jgi:hypothetical protein
MELSHRRSELGIESMGHRQAILKGIYYLRSRSQIYQASASGIPNAPPLTLLHSWPQVFRSPNDNPSHISGRMQSGAPGQTSGSPAPQHQAGLHLPRRIAPTFVTHLGETPRYSAIFGQDYGAVTGQGSADEGSNGERNFQHVGVQGDSEHQTRTNGQTKAYLTKLIPPDLDDGLRSLLARNPPQPPDEDVLPLYGDSGDDGVFDEETWQEIEKDKAINSHSDCSLSLPEVRSIIGQVIEELRSNWQKEKLGQGRGKGFSSMDKS